MPLREDLLTPIAGDNPSGPNLKYDPVTDKIKEARREDIDVPQGDWQRTLKTADWKQVIKLASETIATRSKDLQLAVWLVEAHARVEGFSVLPDGFRFLHDLQDQFWDTLHPEIEDGDVELRGAPLEWLGNNFETTLRQLPFTRSGLSWIQYKETRLVGYEEAADTTEKQERRQAAIDDGKLTPEEFDAQVDQAPKQELDSAYRFVNRARNQLKELAALCDEKYGDYGPSFLKASGALEEISDTLLLFLNKRGGPTPEITEEAAPEEAAGDGGAEVPASAEGGALQGGTPTSVEDAATRIAAICRWMRSKDPYSVAAYMTIRGFRWGEIRYHGADRIDSSLLKAPPAALKAELEKYASESNWDKLLETTEKIMETPSSRAWLDPQCCAVQALEGKGRAFANVAQAIRGGVRGLLQDLPGLTRLSLQDGTPIASQATQAWIQKDVHGGRRADGPPEMDGDFVQGQEDIFDQALEAARQGDYRGALAIVNGQLMLERSGRGQFKRRSQIAHLLVSGGKPQVALPILRDLATVIEENHLDKWESGDVLAYPLNLLIQCMRANSEDTTELFEKVCRLDPAQALDFAE